MRRIAAMRDELLRIALTAVSSFSLGAGTFAYSVSSKASLWEHDKPYIAAALSDMSKDVKTLLGEVSALKEAINARRTRQ